MPNVFAMFITAASSLMNIISVQVDQAAPQAPRLLLPDPELQLNMGELPSRVDLSQWPPMAGGVKDQGFVTL